MDFWRLARWVRNYQGRNLADGDLVYVEDGALRVLAVGATDEVLTASPGATHKLKWAASTGGTGGSGTSDHTALSNLRWTSAGHTDTANRIAGFNGSGAASLYAIGSDLQAWDGDTDAVAGLTFQGIAARTGHNTWALRTLVGPAAGITITNPQGVGGNPSWALANDMAAVEGITTTGLAVRTTTDTWTTRAISVAAGSTGLSIANGDGVAGSPVLTLNPAAVVGAAVVTFVITATGYTTVTLPDCRYVTILCVGGAGSGGNGETGTNAANRGGGGGGASAGWVVGTWRRKLLPSTLYVYVGAGGAANGTNAGDNSLVEMQNTSFTGSGTPQYSSTLMINSTQRAGAGAAGSVVNRPGGTVSTIATIGQAMWAKVAESWTAFIGNGGQAGGASGTPSDLTPFGTGANVNNLAGGAGGAGKDTTPTAANGGKHAAQGHLSATVGGTAPGGAGNPGTYDGGGSSTLDQLSYGYGGTGGASNTGGVGGAGGLGAAGCGGGGGGAGTTGTANSGKGGDGWVVILCFG